MSLLDELGGLVAQQLAPQAASKTGLDQGLAEKMLPMAMTALLGGLKKNVGTPEGAEALSQALNRHDGSLLGDEGRLADSATLADGQRILGHILGGKQGRTTQALAKTAGVNDGQMADLLAMAAPLLMNALGQQKRQNGLDTAGLAGLVADQGVRAQTAAPAAMGGLMSFIDQDGDGDFKDDLLETAGKQLLGGLFGRR